MLISIIVARSGIISITVIFVLLPGFVDLLWPNYRTNPEYSPDKLAYIDRSSPYQLL